jgi:perosamine synthetase
VPTDPVAGEGRIRSEPLPYGKQWVDDEDVNDVVEALRSDWLTTGPRVEEFEHAFAEVVGARHGVAVSNGTAALHAAMYALGIGPGDEVIVPTMTFVASANCVVYQGGIPVLVDVDPETLLIDPAAVERAITARTRAVIAVDYAGQPCDYDMLRQLTEPRGIALVDDAAHSLGGSDHGRLVGTLASLNTFSFHPVKHITTGEGGMITTDDPELARRMRVFRNHGITTDHRQRSERGGFFYEMVDLGFNYRISDIQCALGISQLRKLRAFLRRRREIAERYDAAFGELDEVRPLRVREGVEHAYHLYPVLFETERLSADRAEIFAALREEGIEVNVHYIPVHLHPFYRARFGTRVGMLPVAEAAFDRLVTLPLFPGMADSDADDVVAAVRKVVAKFRR